MVKIVLISLFTLTFASSYENNCVSCHKQLPVSIDKYFYKYLLKYSSKDDVLSAMKLYLKNPSKETTIMSGAFIRRFGVKKPTTLNSHELSKALNIYWKKYEIKNRLK
ncbi:MAG: hypothetical protein U9N42_10210 [Campylobacterota bacterium]|nr:hypothetical protein [Campylobacterota bacterium]